MRNLQIRFLTNKVTIRWLTILNVLERNQTCSLNQISKVTQLSTRTIIKEIQDIRGHFGDAIELSNNNVGYVFTEINYDDYTKFKRALVEEDPMFIVLKSILESTLHSVEEWAFQFHLSESTMKRHILGVSSILKDYELMFSLTPVDLVGNEINIRKFFKDFFYEVDITPHALIPFKEVSEEIFHLGKLDRKKLNTNISPLDFRYFLYIMIQRSKNGKHLEKDYYFKPIDYTNEEKTFLQMIDQTIQKVYQHKISAKELHILFLYCVTQRNIVSTESEENFCARFGHDQLEARLVFDFLENCDAQLKGQYDRIKILLEAFFISIKWLNQIGSVMNKNIPDMILFSKATYPQGYQRSLQFIKDNQQVLTIDDRYQEDVAASLVFTVEAIRDMYVRNPRRIVFLLEGSYFVCRMIHAKAYRYLRGYHQIYFPTIEDLTQSYLEEHQIDLFVTNKEEYLTSLVKDIDFVLFKSLPDTSDWNNLLTTINPQITKDFTLGETIVTKNG